MLASTTLGEASPSQEVPNSDSGGNAPPPLRHMVTVDLRKGSKGDRYYHLTTLVDLGATYTTGRPWPISQACSQLNLEGGEWP
jgi:hypothetical protein